MRWIMNIKPIDIPSRARISETGKKHEDLSNAGPSDAILISSESDPIGKNLREFKKAGELQKKNRKW